MKHIVVTGGARGIGRAIVEQLAGAGYTVTATYKGSKEAANEIAGKYPNVTFCRVDLENRKELDEFITQLNAGPAVDVLVNNAGIYVGKPFENMSEAELYQQVDLNFAAPARLMHGLLPGLQKSKIPLVINISSQAATGKLTGEAMYSAVKAALTTLSFVLRAELNQKGIRFVSVEPFGVNTYGIPEPSEMVLPEELAKLIQYAVELPEHLQLDTLSVSHISQARPDFPDWIER